MPDVVRCPMCGKENPPDLDECQFCQARLTPLQMDAAGDREGGSSEPGERETSSVDWLGSFRSGEGEEAAHPPAQEPSSLPGEDEEFVSDWLSAIRSGSEPEQEASEELSQNDDWLSRLGGAEESTEEEVSPGELPDWMQSLRAEDSSDFNAPEDESLDWLGAEGQEELPDWLSGTREDETPEEAAGESLEAGDVPDWLSDLKSGPAEEVPESGSEEHLPGWLQPQDEEESAVQPDEVPDWLSGFQVEVEPEESEADVETGEIPDWMAQTGADQAEAELEAGSEEPEAEPGELPDWLTQPEAESREEQEPQETAAEPGELPDWLTGPQAEQGAEETEVPVEAGEIPAWMAQFSPEAGEGLEAEPEEQLPDWLQSEDEEEPALETGEVPDWLSEMPTEGEPEDTEAESGEIPAWIDQLAPAEAGEAPEFGPEEQLADWLESEDGESEVPEPAPEEDLPAWLQEEEDSGRLKGLLAAGAAGNLEASLPVEEGAGQDETAASGDDLDWLAEYQGTLEEGEQPTPPAGEAEEDIEAGELPKWLAGAAAAGAAAELFSDQDREGLPEEENDGLAQADLPAWLQAMRPVDEAGEEFHAPEGDDQVEDAGPLAGLRGILPAESDVAEVPKPPAYSVKLQVSETQQQNAELLSALVAAEGKARPVEERQVISPQHLLRLFIAIVLVLMLLWPLTVGGLQVAPPQPPVSDYSFETYGLIDTLPPGAPVLVAFDFTPSFTGELQAAASPVIDQLLFKNAYLAVVSTTATGPAQAERLLAALDPTLAAGQARTYLPGDHYVNLGYVPGGAAGLLSFALSPRATFPAAYDGLESGLDWNTGPLAQIASVSDFDMVVVITESPETARLWIEQVGPLLEDTPLVMVASAQAAPLVRPYYSAASDQVQGLVSGLSGGAAYLTVRSNQALDFWNTFSIGVVTAILLILVGAVVNAISGAIRHSREAKGKRT